MKYKDKNYEDGSWDGEWLGSQGCHCCWYHISAFKEEYHGHKLQELYLGSFGGAEKYYGTWRFRLKAAWSALRGKLTGHSIDLTDKESAGEFMRDLAEAYETAFGEEAP